MNANSPHLKAQQAEESILYRLNQFGSLTATQVAALEYRELEYGLIMARRTLLRLSKHGLVLIKKGSHVFEVQHYALSVAGARKLSQLRDVEARTGKDLLRIVSPHRDASNWCAIHLLREGYPVVWTERDIQGNRAPIKNVGNKIPDFLGIDDQGHCTWGETEASRRGGRDLKSLAEWLRYTAFPMWGHRREFVPLDPGDDTLYLSEVRFVLANKSARTFPKRLAKALVKHTDIQDPADWAQDVIQFQEGVEPDAKVDRGFPEDC